MRLIIWAALGGSLLSSARAEDPQFFPDLRGVTTYGLCVTPMDWRHESKIGITTRQAKAQVRKRLFEGAGLIRCGGWAITPPDALIHLVVDARREEFLKISYRIDFIVTRPDLDPLAVDPDAPVPDIWTCACTGISSRGRFPHHFRKELDAILDRFIEEWRRANF